MLRQAQRAFAKIKHWMRVAQYRTIEETWCHIGHLVATIEPQEGSKLFADAAYASVKT